MSPERAKGKMLPYRIYLTVADGDKRPLYYWGLHIPNHNDIENRGRHG